MANCVVQIEKNERFAKARWELVPRFALIETSSGIGERTALTGRCAFGRLLTNRRFSSRVLRFAADWGRTPFLSARADL